MRPEEFTAPPQEMLDAVHVEQRARERYSMNITEQDRAEMKRQVREGRGVFLSRKTGSRHVKVWLVWWPSAQRIVPIYYHEGRIKSVLPPRSAQQLIEGLERSIEASRAASDEESSHGE